MRISGWSSEVCASDHPSTANFENEIEGCFRRLPKAGEADLLEDGLEAFRPRLRPEDLLASLGARVGAADERSSGVVEQSDHGTVVFQTVASEGIDKHHGAAGLHRFQGIEKGIALGGG